MKKVVVTGFGMITPLGTGVEKSWSNLLSGRSGIGEIQSIDLSRHRVKIGGEVKDFDPLAFMTPKQTERLGRGAQYCLSATLMAIEHAGLRVGDLRAGQVGFYIGTTMGEAQIVQSMVEQQMIDGKVNPRDMARYPAHQLTLGVMDELELSGPAMLSYNACAAGNYAIGLAADCIRRGRTDLAIAGGVDVLAHIAFTGFNRLLSLDPATCRPFDKNRKGIAVSEGAAVLILEEASRALARGAHIYAEMKAYGVGTDAHHLTSPHPKGEGAIRSMQTALANSGLHASDIDYISAHGTGTPANDRMESGAIMQVFGDRPPPVSSIKSMIGHSFGAASAIEAAASCLMLENQVMLPTINYSEHAPNCINDCVPNEPRYARIRHILSNAFAFGGNNASIILSKFAEEA